MMRVLDTWMMRGRGMIAIVKLDGPQPQNGARLRRRRDGRNCQVRGALISRHREAREGDTIGILLDDEAKPIVGDVFDRVTG
jgi:hypothetical protein